MFKPITIAVAILVAILFVAIIVLGSVLMFQDYGGQESRQSQPIISPTKAAAAYGPATKVASITQPTPTMKDANTEPEAKVNQSTKKEHSDFSRPNIFGLAFNDFPFPCIDSPYPEFTSPFFPPGLITAIEPMGKTAPASDHVTPTDHLYIHREFYSGHEYVLAPSDGFIIKIQRFPQDLPLNATDESGRWLGDNNGLMVPDYRLVIMHSCTLFTVFIHLGALASPILEAVGEIKLSEHWSATLAHDLIPVKAGEPIAEYGSQNLDWSVHDADVILDGFVVPQHYKTEPWKIHTVDPFKFYAEPIRTELLEKVIRKSEPRAGEIDFDIEGSIVGNWFIEGSIDYAGSGKPGLEYTKGHLSIVYGYIYPDQLRISIGADTGINADLCRICRGAYGVKGNHPDPADVGAEAGLVKYELMSRVEESRLIREQVGDTSLGTFLVQHLGDRSIKVEVIPGKPPNQVPGFSSAAVIYRR